MTISHNGGGADGHFDAYNAWSAGDTKLDWHGVESGQGFYLGRQADGSPSIWTTNDDSAGAGYSPLNK